MRAATRLITQQLRRSASVCPLCRTALPSAVTSRAATRSNVLKLASRSFTTSGLRRSVYDDFVNILDDGERPPIQVDSCTETTFKLSDGIILPSSSIFLNGVAFMWDVPPASYSWDGWSEDMFQIFEVVTPKPDVVLFGTGRNTFPPPPWLRPYLNSLGIQLDIMDSRNACSTFNLLTEEGRRVAAAVLTLAPLDSRSGMPLD